MSGMSGNTWNSAPRVVAMTGSVREGRFGPTVTQWFVDQARQNAGMSIEVIDLEDYPLPLRQPDFGKAPQPETAQILGALSPRLSAADAFVVITPEYNHSFPASLKNAIDWHNEEWHAKPVGFISYGGISGGLRAVEQLRLVFAELHAVTVRDTVSFHVAWEQFDPEGQPTSPEGCTAAAKTMLDQLLWWARVLREARAAHPYEV